MIKNQVIKNNKKQVIKINAWVSPIFILLDFSCQTKSVHVVMCIRYTGHTIHNWSCKFNKSKLVYILLLETSPVMCTWRSWQCPTAMKASQSLLSISVLNSSWIRKKHIMGTMGPGTIVWLSLHYTIHSTFVFVLYLSSQFP